MTDAERVATYCRGVLPLESLVRSGEEYAYPHLSLCVLDAVWSIGVRYEGVKNVVRRYRMWAELESSSPENLSAFLDRFAPFSPEEAATRVFQNQQRTSTRNGIRKSDAVVRFAHVLQRHGMETVADITQHAAQLSLIETEIRKIPGQASGIAWKYFLMLCGASHLVKPDRMILRFLTSAAGKSFTATEAQTLLTEVCQLLSTPAQPISPRELDNAIWNHQRNR